MGQVLLLLVVALTVAAVVFGVTVLVTGSDPGLGTAEPDGRAVPLPGNRPLLETDVGQVRFDLALRGYRMAQVDQALRRTAYDIGYKDELIGVLQAEVTALREGRLDDADVLRRAREAALVPVGSAGTAPEGALDGSSARALAAAATTGGIGGHSSPVPPVDGPADAAAGGTSGSGERPGPPEPAPLDLPQRAFRADPSTRSDPAAAQPAASSTDERADEGTDERAAERAAERADDAGVTVRARSVREGGSVIEAEDGDLTEPAASVRPAVGAEPVEPTSAEPTSADATSAEPTSTAATGDDPTTGNGGDRPTRADAPAGSGSAAAGSDASAGSGSAAAGPSEPAEQPERA